MPVHPFVARCKRCDWPAAQCECWRIDAAHFATMDQPVPAATPPAAPEWDGRPTTAGPRVRRPEPVAPTVHQPIPAGARGAYGRRKQQ